MANQDGFIKSYRKNVGSLAWSSGDLFKLWHLCLYKANFKNRVITFNGQQILLNRGQFVTGRNALRDEMNVGVKPEQQVNSSFVWRGLKKFEKAEMLHINSTHQYSVVTVLNWDTYQQSEQLPNSYRTATEQQTDTDKNVKNDKNEKNITTTSLSEKNLKSVFDFWEQSGFGLLSPTTMQNFEYWVDDFTKLGATESDSFQLLKKAIQVSDQNGVKKYAYVNSILKNWREKGFKQVADVDAAEAQRNSQKSKNTRQRTEAVGKYLQGDDDDLPF